MFNGELEKIKKEPQGSDKLVFSKPKRLSRAKKREIGSLIARLRGNPADQLSEKEKALLAEGAKNRADRSKFFVASRARLKGIKVERTEVEETSTATKNGTQGVSSTDDNTEPVVESSPIEVEGNSILVALTTDQSHPGADSSGSCPEVDDAYFERIGEKSLSFIIFNFFSQIFLKFK